MRVESSKHTVIHAAGEAPPKIALRQIVIQRASLPGLWRIGWSITNKGAEPLSVVAMRLPHGQFKSDEYRFKPPLKLASGARGQFDTQVRCVEPVGLVTENAFAIFSVIWAEEAWRIFVRLRVVVKSDGKPATATEWTTTQKVGFSSRES